MRGFLLQDWTTVQGDTTTQDVIQSPAGWADVTAFQDAVLWLEVRALVSFNAINFLLETSPSADDALFIPVLAPISMTAGAGPVVSTVLAANSTPTYPPISRWLRWHVQSAAAASWSATFRVSLALNAAMGMTA